jgi:hypothetical protein
MARRTRTDLGDFAYHLLNRRVGRMSLFDEKGDYAAFFEVLDETHAKFPMRAWPVRRAGCARRIMLALRVTDPRRTSGKARSTGLRFRWRLHFSSPPRRGSNRWFR